MGFILKCALSNWIAVATRAIVCAVASAIFCCHAWAQEIPLQVFPGTQAFEGKDIADYPRAIDAILRVLVQKFGLPLPRGKVEIHPTREGFEQALVKYLKIAPALARSTSQFAKAAVGSNTLLINEQAIAGDTWPQRIELIAHELIHLLQLTLANRPGIIGNQWLIEGFAEWMAFQVTDALGLDELSRARGRITDKVRELKRKENLPRLLHLHAFADWVGAREKYGFDGTYSLSFLITDFLIERHSVAAVLDYFRRFQRSADHDANLKAAFGEGLDDFELALDRHLDGLLK